MPVQRPGPESATPGPHSYAPCPGQSTAGREPGGGERNQYLCKKNRKKFVHRLNEQVKINIILRVSNQYPNILSTLAEDMCSSKDNESICVLSYLILHVDSFSLVILGFTLGLPLHQALIIAPFDRLGKEMCCHGN